MFLTHIITHGVFLQPMLPFAFSVSAVSQGYGLRSKVLKLVKM